MSGRPHIEGPTAADTAPRDASEDRREDEGERSTAADNDPEGTSPRSDASGASGGSEAVHPSAAEGMMQRPGGESGDAEDPPVDGGGGGGGLSLPYWWASWDWGRTAAWLSREPNSRALASRTLFFAMDDRASETYLRNLVELRPEILRTRNQAGDLPLHVLMKKAAAGGPGGSLSAATIIAFVEGYRDAVVAEDSNGYLPLWVWVTAWKERLDLGVARKFRDVLRTMLDAKPEGALDRFAREQAFLDAIELYWLDATKKGLWDDMDDEARDDHLFFLVEEREYLQEVYWDVLMMALRATWQAQRRQRGVVSDDVADFLPIHSYLQLENRGASLLKSVSSNEKNEMRNAIRKGDLNAYISLCGKYGQPLFPGNDYYEALQLSYKMNRMEVLADIIGRYPQQVRTADADGERPLHLAAQQSLMASDVFRLLLEKDTSAASAPDRNGRLPLHLAIEAGRAWEDGVDALLAAAPRAASVLDRSGHFPLQLAIEAGWAWEDGLDALLTAAPRAASAADRNGRLPLHHAIEAGRSWEEGLDVLLNAAPRALETPDLITFLYPFMAAAVGNDNDLDTTPRLLRQSPDLVLGLSRGGLIRPTKRVKIS